MNHSKNWKKPKIIHGKFTKYNWVVQHPDNLKLGKFTDIGMFTYINAFCGVEIKTNSQIGSHCSIYSISTIDGKKGKVLIGTNARIGSHSVIMPGVTIGENAIIAACSFVNKDIPPNTVSGGVPVKFIKRRGAL
jgi:acetyltransferase-like isoleucine patch superfamily enzyme